MASTKKSNRSAPKTLVKEKNAKLKASHKTKPPAKLAKLPTSEITAVNKSRVRVGEKEFISRLTEKLTQFDANMILEAAMLHAGVQRQEGFFKKDETREICLALIKRGGPAYSVGAGIYREVVG
jgi:hypothetical protein